MRFLYFSIRWGSGWTRDGNVRKFDLEEDWSFVLMSRCARALLFNLYTEITQYLLDTEIVF